MQDPDVEFIERCVTSPISNVSKWAGIGGDIISAMKDRSTALLLSYITVTYNVFEGAASLVFATLAGSPALTGFGIDSFVESLSGAVMIWHFSHKTETNSENELQSA